MPKEVKVKQRKQDLGIFYTDQRIVNFIYDILGIWKEKEEKETGRWEKRKHFPSVIDPACGEGVFLKKAIESGFTGYHPKYKAPYIFGADIDENVIKDWEKLSILGLFKGNREMMNLHFFGQNGLLELPDHRLPYKKAEDGLTRFDAVVGNPPFGGIGLGKTDLSDDLVYQLASFEILPKSVQNNLISANTQSNFLNISKKLAIKPDAKKRIESFPIEILFLERFIKLAKPGGWIAIIIPDGILTNSNSSYIREFIADKAKVEAVISLPRDAFKNAGTSAKTSILFLHKYKEQSNKQRENHPVFLALIESLEKKHFDLVRDNYKNYYYKAMSNKNLVQTTSDEKGREIVMVRADKTLSELMKEKPASRWDPSYWHPKYENNFAELFSSGLELTDGESVISVMTNGNRDREWANDNENRIRFIQVVNVLNTGVDFETGDPNKHYAKKNGLGDPERSRVKNGDILLISGATGSIGRACILSELPEPTNISQDINLIRLHPDSRISKYYFTVFLLSLFGNFQLERFSKGVSGQIKVGFDHIKAIKIPVLPKSIQDSIEAGYKEISKYHSKAMKAKKSNDRVEYKKNIETAEYMLKDLIAKTEIVIRGERKNII